MNNQLTESLKIREVVERWAVYRDAGLWDEFATVWHSRGYMTATWFQGTATEFIKISAEGLQRGVRILHFLGGTATQIEGNRAIAQTKMTISQRAVVHDVEVDVVCTGRFYDFLEVEDEQWKIVRRQPIYEKDRMDPVNPAAQVELDPAVLEPFPIGYRYLAYLQQEAGFTIKKGLPGLLGPEVELLYAEGREWLSGSADPGIPL